jgi:predicted enzyme related to lactoylglutathione lyase
MITGTHAIVYSADADATRAFLRDVLGLPHVDAGGGWLIFRLPPAELGVHPTGDGAGPAGRYDLYLMCDDVDATVAGLRAKGVECTGEPQDAGFGRVTGITAPGGVELGLYEPRHPTALDA